LCILAYIIGICWGNCTKLSYFICPYRGIKCLHLILGSFSPKILEPKNIVLTTPFFDFIANISTLVQDIVDWKMACKVQSLPHMPTQFGELWSTNGENGTVLQLTQNQLFRTLISHRLRGRSVKNFTVGNDDQRWSEFLRPKI